MARRNKDYSMSDNIRNQLAEHGIALMDVGTDTIWKPCLPIKNCHVS
ncbi:cysteine--tRNA ligase 2, cytoplasmic-like isoform X1 [Senna tora]|uniref:Cysteine--tRNA ligase 2, cytoplasmic-like isoform X1 n=1 Tax=Senna tora TaxID=362788 RepID=A0A834WWD3_9FABA|nr:cysteine--tRNA ligase 2, cytoplasmic-like isoform X1 [Senna tora]